MLAASDRAACLEWCFAELCFRTAVQWCDIPQIGENIDSEVADIILKDRVVELGTAKVYLAGIYIVLFLPLSLLSSQKRTQHGKKRTHRGD